MWRSVRLLWIALLSFPLALLTAADEPPAPDDAPKFSNKQIQQWVKDLDSDRFTSREKATLQLVAAGRAGIPQLVAALPGTNLEMVTRGVYVLRELALSEDLETAQAARLALEGIAKPRKSMLASRATATLARLDQIRQARAIEILEELGAKIGRGYTQIGAAIVSDLFTVEVGAEWKGNDKDLQRLQWLGDVDQITMIGPKISDESVRLASQMKNVTIVIIKRAKITNRAIAHLKNLENLEHIAIQYSPIDDMCVDHLKVHNRVGLLKLYGTEMSQMGAGKLAEAMPTTKVDFRHGAFLGIGCNVHPEGCQVAIIHPDSSAAKSDIRLNDVIVLYEGKRAPDFETLTKLIAANKAGDTVTMEILRGEEKLTKKITLGEWE